MTKGRKLFLGAASALFGALIYMVGYSNGMEDGKLTVATIVSTICETTHRIGGPEWPFHYWCTEVKAEL